MNKIAAASMLLIITALYPAVASEKTDIRVRLIDAHSGKPYAGRDAQLSGTNSPSGGLKTKDIIFDLQTRTGPDGIALFQITAPLPYRLLFYSAQANGCGPPGFASFVTTEVIASGVVVPNTCAGKRQKYNWQNIKAGPGEIIIFAVEPRGP